MLGLLESLADRLSDARKNAKQTNDFSEVDRIKKELIAAGLEVRMSKDEIRLVPEGSVDLARLEALL